MFDDNGLILMIEITLEEYNKLRDSQLKLICLENAGVDNWDGYSSAMGEFDGIKGYNEE